MLFLKNGELLSTLTKDAYDLLEVITHEVKYTNILYSIQDFVENSRPLPLPADIYCQNQPQHCKCIYRVCMYYRNNDGTQTKSKTKILVFKITWCIIIVFCTSASGVSFC